MQNEYKTITLETEMIDHKFENVRVGDKLYSLLHGEITITEILNRDPYPVRGRALNGDTNQFFSWTFDGRGHRGDLNSDLYWEKPEIIEKPRKQYSCGWVLLLKQLSSGPICVSSLYKTKEVAIIDTAYNKNVQKLGDPIFIESEYYE